MKERTQIDFPFFHREYLKYHYCINEKKKEIRILKFLIATQKLYKNKSVTYLENMLVFIVSKLNERKIICSNSGLMITIFYNDSELMNYEFTKQQRKLFKKYIFIKECLDYLKNENNNN